ncbi:MAG: GNAT family N-acetyltransferase [Planctomycetes bacterium]|nr:GNAT family N-acetyltransferase [Planctomycetota bacterium]
MTFPAFVEEATLPPTIPLGRFTLRPLRVGDEAHLHGYWSDPRVTEHTSIPALDIAATRDTIHRCIADYASARSCRWAFVDEHDILVGTCGFSNWSLVHSHAELVYDLAPSLWHRGLMRTAIAAVLSWAFTTAGFNRVHAFVMVTNQPSDISTSRLCRRNVVYNPHLK